VATK
jgi:hypothetical protein